MLSPSVRMLDLEGDHLAGWLELLTPPALLRDDAPWALVFVERAADAPGATAAAGHRVVKAVRAPTGALDPAEVPFTGTSKAALAALRRGLDACAVIVLETDALPRLLAAVEGALDLDDDLVAQGTVILREAKQLSGRGIWTDPPLLDLLPAPSAAALQSTFDLLVPDRTSLVAYVVADDRTRIHASVIATKSGGQITGVATHLAVADLVSEASLARSWRSQYRRVLDAVADRYAPPSLAVFCERATFERILTGPADQFGRELSARNLVIDPAPGWMLGLIGGATAFAVASRGAQAMARFLPEQARRMARDLASTAGDVIRDSGAHPFALLGFDPIELWHGVRHYYRRRG